MSEISTQAVIDAITLALRAAYPTAHILDDEAKQGITPGAFIVTLVSAGQRQIRGPLYGRTPLFDVIYFSDNSAEECAAVADALCMALDMVTTPGGDLLRGTGMEWRIDEDVLHFMVGYGHHVLRETEQDFMETLKIQEGELYG
jgi:hypothetical protein